MDRFFDAVQIWTENKLTQRKARKVYRKQHKSFGSEVLSWLDALAFAVAVVFLINQFLFQLFVIPSPSMQNTMLIGDRVVVSKMTYGIESYPYGPKLFDSRTPDRDDLITFYNPEYQSKGTGFSILSKVLYMATFGLWNIEVDEQGNPGEWLLVKRCAASEGDSIKFINGDAYIKPRGTNTYIKESDFRDSNNFVTAPVRSIDKETYRGYNARARLNGISSIVKAYSMLPKHLLSDNQTLDSNAFYTDYYGFEKNFSEGIRTANPLDSTARSEHAKKTVGIYVPENCVLPLGDNRDNSTDGRYFGPVDVKTITGFVAYTFWPVSRARSLVNL